LKGAQLLDKETVVYAPHANPDAPDDERVCVLMKTRGCTLALFFGDLGRQGPVLEVQILPDTAELAPHVLRNLMPQAPLYVQYARAVMTANDVDWIATSKALRDLGSTRRGLSDEFYRLVADNYRAIVAGGEPHPVKALAEMHHVVISTASRWIKEARRRGEDLPVAEREKVTA
jgi:hypothetical protein